MTPLTAWVLSSFGLLIAVGTLILATEHRWSAWRYNVQSIALWQVLMVIGSILHRQDYLHGSLFNGYFMGILIALMALVLLNAWMSLNSSTSTQTKIR